MAINLNCCAELSPSPAGRAAPAAGEGWGGGSVHFTANAIQSPLRQHTFQDTAQKYLPRPVNNGSVEKLNRYTS